MQIKVMPSQDPTGKLPVKAELLHKEGVIQESTVSSMTQR